MVFLLGLFNDHLSVGLCLDSNDAVNMNEELMRVRKEAFMAYQNYQHLSYRNEEQHENSQYLGRE
jgi:hypothetical protein